MGLSEDVRTTVALREAEMGEKRRRENKKYLRAPSHNVEGKGAITQGREQNTRSRIGDVRHDDQ